MTVPARPTPLFADIADVSRRLASTGYLRHCRDGGLSRRRSASRCWWERNAGYRQDGLARAVAQAADPVWSGCSTARASTSRPV